MSLFTGFDPTADSLHIGNLLVLMGLLHAQRSGLKPVAVIGGATGKLAEPVYWSWNTVTHSAVREAYQSTDWPKDSHNQFPCASES